jgi:hypothetical protein
MDEPDEKDVSDVDGLRGEEPNEEYYFCFSATLRVHGDRAVQVSATGLPTMTHSKHSPVLSGDLGHCHAANCAGRQ